MKKIITVISSIFEDYLILSLSKDWIQVFNGIPEFEVFIDKQNRLQLISKQMIGLEIKGERDTKRRFDII